MSGALARSWTLVIIGLLAGWSQSAPAQTDPLNARSLASRSALHQNPTLEGALERLVSLYTEAGRTSDLIQIYENHLQQYPNDRNARVVLTRILLKLNRPEARISAESLVSHEPALGYAHYLLFLSRKNDPDRYDSLLAAVDRETDPNLKQLWLERLAQEAPRDRYGEALQKLLSDWIHALGIDKKDQRLRVAGMLKKIGATAEALAAAEALLKENINPEMWVEASLLAAESQRDLGDTEAAIRRLDGILARLGPDHWRRSSIWRLRLDWAPNQASREKLLTSLERAAQAPQAGEGAFSDWALVLRSLERRETALSVLRQGLQRHPDSRRLEREALELFQALGMTAELESWLIERGAERGQREDLSLELAKLWITRDQIDRATALIDRVAEKWRPEVRMRRLAELSRKLRSEQIPLGAALVMERAFLIDPTRLDLLREALELRLILHQREEAARLLARAQPKEARGEALVDLLSFLLEKSLLLEARQIVDAAGNHPDFQVGLMALEVDGQLAARTRGWDRLRALRQRISTDVEYERWISRAISFTRLMQELPQFIREEQERLLSEIQQATGDAEGILERAGLLIDALLSSGESRMASEALEQLRRLERAEESISVQRRTVRVWIRDPARRSEVEDALVRLAQLEPHQAANHEAARLVLATQQEGRSMEELSAQFDSLELGLVTDIPTLHALLNWVSRGQMVHRELKILDRLLQIDPANQRHWESWLSALARSGQEKELRRSLRVLLDGVDSLQLSPESRARIQDHFVASVWRDTLRAWSRGEKSEQIPVWLEEAESLHPSLQSRLILAWLRWGWLTRYGDQDAAHEARQVLSRLAPETLDGTEGVRFPDGIWLALDGHLWSEGSATPEKVTDRIEPPFEVAWRWDLPHLRVIVALQEAGGQLAIADQSGKLSMLDTTTGKLIWERPDFLAFNQVPQWMQTIPHWLQQTQQHLKKNWGTLPWLLTTDRVIVADLKEVRAYHSTDGTLVWKSPLEEPRPPRAPSMGFAMNFQPRLMPPALAVWNNQVLVFEPEIGRLSALAIEHGKVLWEKFLAGSRPTTSPFVVDFQVRGHRVLLSAPGYLWVLDLHQGGQVMMEVNPARAKRFPPELRLKNDQTTPDQAQDSGTHSTHGLSAGWHVAPTLTSMRFIDLLNPDQSWGDSGAPATIVGSALTAWVARAASTPEQLVTMDGRHLFFGTNQEWGVVDLNFPWRAKTFQLQGRFLGINRGIGWLESPDGKLHPLSLTPSDHLSPVEDTERRGRGTINPNWLGMASAGDFWVSVHERRLVWIHGLSGRAISSDELPATAASRQVGVRLKMTPRGFSAQIPNPNSTEQTFIHPMGIVRGNLIILPVGPGTLVGVRGGDYAGG